MLARSQLAQTLKSVRGIGQKAVVGSRGFSDALHKKEQAAENTYFNKQDEKALRKLLKKFKQQTDVTDASGKVEHEKYDLEGLSKISGLSLTADQKQALLKWKHDH